MPKKIAEIKRTAFGVKVTLDDGSYRYLDDTDQEVGEVYDGRAE